MLSLPSDNQRNVPLVHPLPHNPNLIRRFGNNNGMECIMQPELEHLTERLVSGMSEAVVFADATGLIQF